MFDNYNLQKVVKNKALLKTFNFDIIEYDQRFILVITKKDESLKFAVDLDEVSTNFLNLLSQEFFPSSVSIFSKLSKPYVEEFFNFESLLNAVRGYRTNERYYFSRAKFRLIIKKYFRYKNISFNEDFDLGLTLYHRSKKNIKVVSINHPLLKTFYSLSKKAIYNKQIFDAVVKVFEMAEDRTSGVDDILSSLKVKDCDLWLQSLFNQDLTPCNFGQSLSSAMSGFKVFYGEAPFLKLDKSILSSLQELPNLSNLYNSKIRRMEELSSSSRQNVLTEEFSRHYNEEIPDVCYWNA